MPNTSPEAPQWLLRLAPWIDLLAKTLAAVASALVILHQMR